MSSTTSKDGPRSRARIATGGNSPGNYTDSHVLRTARALIGTTPAELAAHIGANPPAKMPVSDRPVQSPEDLTRALRVLIGWYRVSLANAATPAAVTTRKMSLDEVVRQYLALRSQWEGNEAIQLAAQMRGNIIGVPFDVSRPPVAAQQAPTLIRRRALLVDDSQDTLIDVGSSLESLGFDVVSALSADIALRILGDGKPVDVLVTDHLMPGMTGRDLAWQACRDDQNLRVCIITGHPDDEELEMLPPHVTVLAKPFRRAQLSAHIGA